MKKHKKLGLSFWELLKFIQFFIGVYTLIIACFWLSFYNALTNVLLGLGGISWIIITLLCWRYEPKSWKDD